MATSPYAALLVQMRQVLDTIDEQTPYNNSDALQVFDECARRIHDATVPDPLYQPMTRPPAIDEAIRDATLLGDGFLHIGQLKPNEHLIWTRLDPQTVVVKTLTTQGETP